MTKKAITLLAVMLLTFMLVVPTVKAQERISAHDSIGTSQPADTWYLAEGATLGGFETWVLVQNPNATTTQANITFMTDSGQVAGPTLNLKANSRESVNVGDHVQTYNVSTKVTAAQPVIAERSMYYNNRTCAHDSIGTSQPADIWYLAEGATLGGFETWVLVQNPNPTTTQANITFMTDSGQVAGPTLNLKANSRESVNVGDHVQTYNVSTKVTAAQPVIAERSMYYNNRTCAHDSIGTSQPADIWYLAEGCTDGGFETWVLVQNPNDTWTQATLTFMTDSGPVAGPTLGLQANSRRSVNVGDHVQTYNVSTKVTAAQPVIAERSMYWSKPLPPPPPPSFTSDDYPTAPGLTQHYWTGSNLDEDGRLNIEGLPVGGPWLLNNSEDDYSICAYINPADNYAYGNFSGSNMGRVWSGEPNTSQFFYKDSSSMSYLGYAQPEIVGYRTLKFDPPSLSYRFPFSVGDSWGSSSSYQITGLSPGHGSYTRNTNVLAYTRIIHMKREGFSPCFA